MVQRTDRSKWPWRMLVTCSSQGRQRKLLSDLRILSWEAFEMSRREFSRAVKVEIIKRATRNSQVYCEREGCGLPCRKFEIHHLVMDAMETDKSRKLTAANGALWCIPCHDAETKAQAPILAKARAREAAHVGATRPAGRIKSPGFPPSPRAANRVPKNQLQPKVLFR